MVNINIICVGKLKEKYWTDAAAEYVKRLSRYCRIRIVELKEERLPDNASASEEEYVKTAEGRSILKSLSADSYVIALDGKGKQLSSEHLSQKIESLTLGGCSTVDLIIGGSLGLSDEVRKRADFKLSFSSMTFPHQMMRVILLEQIFTIDKSRIERFIGYATPGNVWSASAIRPFRNAVAVAVIRSFALDCILRSSLVSSSLLNGGSVSQKVSA